MGRHVHPGVSRHDPSSGYTLHITFSIGPLVYVKLAPGHYRLVASFEGEQQQHNVQVEAGAAAKVNLHWR